MSYIRVKEFNGNKYLYEQESYREDGKTRTRHVRYVGKLGTARTGPVRGPSPGLKKKGVRPKLRARPGKARRDYDRIAARELELYTENDADLYRQMLTPINRNLVRKKESGQYDRNRAVKAYLNAVDESARKYSKEYGGKYDKPTRLAVARSMRDTFEQEYKSGNYDDMHTKKWQKAQTKAVPKKTIDIGDDVSVKGINLKGRVTHIRQGDHEDPTKYKVGGKYWNESSVVKTRKAVPKPPTGPTGRWRKSKAYSGPGYVIYEKGEDWLTTGKVGTTGRYFYSHVDGKRHKETSRKEFATYDEMRKAVRKRYKIPYNAGRPIYGRDADGKVQRVTQEDIDRMKKRA